MATIGTPIFSRGQATSANPAFAGVALPQRGVPTTPPHLVGFAASYGDAFACSGPDRSTRQAVRSHLDCCDALERQAFSALQALRKGDDSTAARWFGQMRSVVASQSALRPIGFTPAWQHIWIDAQAAWAQVSAVADLFGCLPSSGLQSILTPVVQRDQTFIAPRPIPHRTGSTRKDLADRVLRRFSATASMTPIEGGLTLVALPAAQHTEARWYTGVEILGGVPLTLPLHLDENPYARALFALLNWTWESNSGDDGGTIRFHDPDLTPELAQGFEEHYANAVGEVQ